MSGATNNGNGTRVAPGVEKRHLPEPEIQIAAAAITAAVSPPLGLALAAGSALRSPRVRETLRKGAVQAVAGAIQLGDQLTETVRRAEPAESAPAKAQSATAQRRGKATAPKPSS